MCHEWSFYVTKNVLVQTYEVMYANRSSSNSNRSHQALPGHGKRLAFDSVTMNFMSFSLSLPLPLSISRYPRTSCVSLSFFHILYKLCIRIQIRFAGEENRYQCIASTIITYGNNIFEAL